MLILAPDQIQVRYWDGELAQSPLEAVNISQTTPVPQCPPKITPTQFLQPANATYADFSLQLYPSANDLLTTPFPFSLQRKARNSTRHTRLLVNQRST